MTHCRFLLPTLLCVGSSLWASGCSQGPWGWGKPSAQDASANAESLPGGTLDPAASNTKLDDKMPKNPLALARLSERRNQADQAERLYQEIIKKSPKNPAPYHRLAVLYARQGKMRQAEENFSRALALKANDPEMLSDAGYFYYLTGRPQQAEQHLRRALELSPGNRKYYTNLALAVAEQGRRDEAYTLFRQAGTELQATANLAFVHSQRGEYQQAIAMYDRALTEDPSMRVAADAMVELSKLTSRKAPDRSSPTGAESRPALASHTTPAPNAAQGRSASSASDSLVTITDGRPVSPANPSFAGAGLERPASNTPYPASPVAAYQSPPGADRGQPAASPEVACAYVTPASAAPSPEVALHRAPAQIAAQVPEPTAIKVRPSDIAPAPQPSPPTNRPDATAAPRNASTWRPEFLAGATAGILFLGIGAIALFRGRRATRAPDTPRDNSRGRHRSNGRPFRERGVFMRIRPVAEHSRRSRA